MANDEKYFTFFDVSKGIAIFCVVLCHSISPAIRGMSRVYLALFETFNSTLMPLFAAISGYLFEINISKYKTGGFHNFAFKRIKTLMIPYFTFSILSYIFFTLAFLFPTTQSILVGAGYSQPQFISSITQILFFQGNMDKHLWYVYAYFIILILSFLFSDFFKRPLGIIISIAMFFLNYFIVIPGIIYHVFAIFFFFNISRQTAVIDRLLNKNKIFIYLLIFPITCITRFENWLIWNRYLDAANTLIVGLSSTLLVMSLSLHFVRSFPKRLFVYLGKESFPIYLLHQPIFVSGTCGILLALTSLPAYIICLIATLSGILISLFLSNKVIKKIPLLARFMFGYSVSKKTKQHGRQMSK